MNTITIKTKNEETYSTVSNFFIDYYMTDANGEFVKVYLYLIRLLHSNQPFTIADIADHFNLTEKDICRAIQFWIRQDVMQLEYDTDNVPIGITLLPLSAKKQANQEDDSFLSMFHVDKQANTDKKVTVLPIRKSEEKELIHNETTTMVETATIPQKQKYEASYLSQKQQDEDFGNLLYQTETYFGKPLTQSDIQTLIYIYDDLAFSPELLEYLVEYCVSIGKKSCRYIEAVAIDWYKNNITSVDSAKIASKNYNSIYVAVLKQLGIPRRVPTPTETSFIDTWYNTYSFNKDIIIEACKRAITANPHSANFNYVNGILESWYKQNVHKRSDIEELDRKWAEEKKKKRTSGSSSTNQFNQYKNATSDELIDEFENLFLQETNQA